MYVLGKTVNARTLLTALCAICISVCIGSCCPEDPFVPTYTAHHGEAFLRVVHAADDAPRVHAYLDSNLYFSLPIGYLGFPAGVNDGKYYPADTASKTIRFRDTLGAILASQQISMDFGKYYTAYLYGKSGDYRVLITADDPTNVPDATHCRYRFVHLSPDAPSVTVRQDRPDNTPVVTDLAYGAASDYVTSVAYPLPQGTGIYVVDALTSKTLLGIGPPYIILPGSSVVTIVMSARSHPAARETFLTLTPLTDNSLTGNPPLYGAPPLFNLSFTAVRFVNIVPCGASTYDLAFFDASAEFAPANNWRRNLPGMEAALDIPHLENRVQTYYFVMSPLFKQAYPWHTEVHKYPSYEVKVQDSITPKMNFNLEGNRLFTLVAYGRPDSPLQARPCIIDEFADVSSASGTHVRFFNGEFGAYKDSALRIRVAGIESAPVTFKVSAKPNTIPFDIPAGVSTIELLTASNTVIYTLPGFDFKDKTVYTAYLSRGSDGNALRIDMLASNIILQ